MWGLLAQADASGGALTTILAALLAGGVGAALIGWLRGHGKDEAERKSIVEDVNEIVWQRTKRELELATSALDIERAARAALELKLDTLNERLKLLEGQRDAAHEETVAGLLEAIPDAVIQAGSDGLISRANAAAHKLFGYGPGGLVGMPLTALMPPRYHANHRAGFEQAILTGEGTVLGSKVPIRVFALCRNGNEIEVAMRLSKSNGTFTNVLRPFHVARNGDDADYPLIDPSA